MNLLLAALLPLYVLAGTASGPAEPVEERKSYLLPALEIFGFELLLNRVDESLFGEDYAVRFSTIEDNLHRGWVVEHDPFQINQLGHPYQGSMYHGFARSAGLNYWESFGYTFAGSLLWEIAGETTTPSRNDQIASGIGGSFLGEALFRMAHLVLERGHGSRRWLETRAALISPATGFNRRIDPRRREAVHSSRDAAYYSRVQFGVSGAARDEPGSSTRRREYEGLLDVSLEYGLPGKPDYRYAHPFDYFTFQGTASSANAVENVLVRGLLAGRGYGGGESYRGVWGLYANYDYIAPQTFRVSSTAVSLGTTYQGWLSETVALQGTALLGVGYAAVGTLHGTDDHEYHYGVAPQALLASRLIFGSRFSLDVSAHEYFVSGLAAAPTGGHDEILRGDLSLALRIRGKHAIAAKYLWNRREAAFTEFPDTTQTRGTFGLFYTRLGHDRFGAIDWRQDASARPHSP